MTFYYYLLKHIMIQRIVASSEHGTPMPQDARTDLMMTIIENNNRSRRAPVQPPRPRKRRPFTRPEPKINRNSPCPCGSGLKSKNCNHEKQ